ncbi:MAG: hypothetical protein LBO63_06970 [Oscillospiraceae bacterium]|nr:hypothetical protein [Oscillospiraceae bacterium]
MKKQLKESRRRNTNCAKQLLKCKPLVFVTSAALAFVMTLGSTAAWFTSSDSNTNNFRGPDLDYVNTDSGEIDGGGNGGTPHSSFQVSYSNAATGGPFSEGLHPILLQGSTQPRTLTFTADIVTNDVPGRPAYWTVIPGSGTDGFAGKTTADLVGTNPSTTINLPIPAAATGKITIRATSVDNPNDYVDFTIMLGIVWVNKELEDVNDFHRSLQMFDSTTPYNVFIYNGQYYLQGTQATMANAPTSFATGVTGNQQYPIPMKWSAAAGDYMTVENVSKMILNTSGIHVLKRSDDIWYFTGQDCYGIGSVGSADITQASGTTYPWPVPQKWSAAAGDYMTGASTVKIINNQSDSYILKNDGYWYSSGMNTATYPMKGDGTTTMARYPTRMKWNAGTDIAAADILNIRVAQNIILLLRQEANGEQNWYSIGMNTGGARCDGTVSTEAAPPDPYPTQMLWSAGNKMTAQNADMSYNNGQRYVVYILNKTDNIFYASGENASGLTLQGTGAGNTGGYPLPMQWNSTTYLATGNVKQIETSWYGIYILKTDGTWWAAGLNANGELSDGTTQGKSLPVQMKWSAAAGDYITEASVKNIKGGRGFIALEKQNGVWYGAGVCNKVLNQYTSFQIVGNSGENYVYPQQMYWSSGVPLVTYRLYPFDE